MSDEPTGHVVALALKAALAPVQAKLEIYGEQLARLEPLIGGMRERLAVAEARPPLPGPPGPAGADGVRVDELTVVQDPDDDRIITLGYRRGDQTKTIGTLRLSTPRYCGIYEGERVYSPGDQVTHAGALWHCHATTRNKPGGGGDGWTLQVKRGQG